jgi:hypothetical protein
MAELTPTSTREEHQQARDARRLKRGDAAEMGAYEADLRREMHETRAGQRARELGEDRQVGVQPDPLDTTDAER